METSTHRAYIMAPPCPHTLICDGQHTSPRGYQYRWYNLRGFLVSVFLLSTIAICGAQPSWQQLSVSIVGVDPAQRMRMRIDSTTNTAYVAFSFEEDVVVDGERITSRGQHDVVLVAISPSGSPLWTKTFGGPGDDLVGDLVLTPDGDLLLAANCGGLTTSLPTYEIGDITLTGRGNYDAVLVRLTSAGAVRWTRVDGSVYSDIINTVSISASGIVTGGFFVGQSRFGPTPVRDSLGQPAAFLHATTPTGQHVDVTVFSPVAGDGLRSPQSSVVSVHHGVPITAVVDRTSDVVVGTTVVAGRAPDVFPPVIISWSPRSDPTVADDVSLCGSVSLDAAMSSGGTVLASVGDGGPCDAGPDAILRVVSNESTSTSGFGTCAFCTVDAVRTIGSSTYVLWSWAERFDVPIRAVSFRTDPYVRDGAATVFRAGAPTEVFSLGASILGRIADVEASSNGLRWLVAIAGNAAALPNHSGSPDTALFIVGDDSQTSINEADTAHQYDSPFVALIDMLGQTIPIGQNYSSLSTITTTATSAFIAEVTGTLPTGMYLGLRANGRTERIFVP